MTKRDNKPLVDIRNRVVELRLMMPRDLLDHPGQWRDHMQGQADAMIGALRTIGKTDALKAWYSERAGGALVTWDGHLRKSLDPDSLWPVLITDLTDAEADFALLTHDPLGAMAGTDKAALDALLDSVHTGDAGIQAMLSELAKDVGLMSDAGEWGDAMGGLPTGDKAPFQQMTFTVSDAQAETVKAALQAAKQSGGFDDTGNENSNGNALARICEAYDGRS